MCEKLVDVEEYFQLWRFRHMKTVERIIGFRPGTGGSSGVGFLRQALELTFFPELLGRPYRTEATMSSSIAAKPLPRLGPGALTEESVQQHIAPLFSRVLAGDSIYLATIPWVVPSIAMAEDVREATMLWETKLGDAWDDWLAEQEAFRARIADSSMLPVSIALCQKHLPDRGSRAVLNALPEHRAS